MVTSLLDSRSIVFLLVLMLIKPLLAMTALASCNTTCSQQAAAMAAAAAHHHCCTMTCDQGATRICTLLSSCAAVQSHMQYALLHAAHTSSAWPCTSQVVFQVPVPLNGGAAAAAAARSDQHDVLVVTSDVEDIKVPLRALVPGPQLTWKGSLDFGVVAAESRPSRALVVTDEGQLPAELTLQCEGEQQRQCEDDGKRLVQCVWFRSGAVPVPELVVQIGVVGVVAAESRPSRALVVTSEGQLPAELTMQCEM